MSKLQTPIFLLLFLLLAACTTALEPPVAERPTANPATLTPFAPVVTMTPYTPEPTNTVTATPQSFYENVWISGLLRNRGNLRVGSSNIANGLLRNTTVSLQAADATTADLLNSLPLPNVLVMATGDFYYESAEDYGLVVKSIELLNLPYSAETPLDATYHHTEPEFTFDYPTDWFIRPLEAEEGILQLSNVPAENLWLEGEYFDPTHYDLTVSVPQVDSIEAYVDQYAETDPLFWEAEMLELNGRPIAKVTVHPLGPTVTYVVEINGEVLAFSDWGPQTDFMERIIATLR